MKRRTRIILWTFAGLFAACGAVVGWTLWLIDGQVCWIEWETDRGGLILSYFPGKQQIHMEATDAYLPGEALHWRMIEPGKSNRWLGAPTVPPIEDLFARAHVLQKRGRSTPHGLIAFYADANELRRMQIADTLEDMYQRGDRTAINDAIATGNHPWLKEVVARAAPQRPQEPD